MPNTQSAIKRMRQNPKRRLRNRYFAGRARSFVRNAREHIENEKVEEARAAVQQAISALDKAAEKGVLHRNNAARRKSRLMKQLAELAKEEA